MILHYLLAVKGDLFRPAGSLHLSSYRRWNPSALVPPQDPNPIQAIEVVL